MNIKTTLQYRISELLKIINLKELAEKLDPYITHPASTGSGSGDMTAAVYDPTTVVGDAFDYTNFSNTPTIPTSVDDLGPSQTGNSGKFLTTDGANASWDTPTGGSGDMAAVTYDPATKAEQVLTIGDVVDEDLMTSDSAILVPTQQSVKAYVDTSIASVTYYDYSEVTTYLAALAVPLSTAQENRLKDFVVSLKIALQTNDLSLIFDVFYILANETEEAALLNLIKRSHDATNVHATTFTAWEGFTGDAANDYIDTNYNPSTQGVTFQQNFASYGAYCRSYDAADGLWDLHVTGAAGHTCAMGFRGSNSTAADRVYINSATFVSTTPDMTGLGFKISTRSTSALVSGFINTTVNANLSLASTGRPNEKFFLCAGNADGTMANPTDSQLSCFFAGGGLTTTQTQLLISIFKGYMVDLGKAVA